MNFFLIVFALVLGASVTSGHTTIPMNENSPQAIPESTDATPTASLSPLRYLALGDSYTIGESVSPLERFPVELSERLRTRGFKMERTEIIARTGWTTDELWNAMDASERQPSSALQRTYDLVTLLIGVNNQYRGRAAETYRPEFVKLLQRAIVLAGNRPSHVIVVSIPDWGVTPFGRNRKNVGAEIDAFNAVNRAETVKLGAHYVDITPISREALHDTTMLAHDGLHPSGKMYSQWVDLILPVAQEILKQAPNASLR